MYSTISDCICESRCLDKACDDGGEDVGSEVLVEENCEADSTTVAAISSLPASTIPDEPVNSFICEC